MKCILHIGTEKTGTSSIQSFLNLNRDILKKEARVLYTKSLGAENNRGLSFLAYAPDQEDDFTMQAGLKTLDSKLAYQEKLFRLIAQELEANTSTVDSIIFSSEHLQSRLKNPAHIARLKKILDKLDLSVERIILYIRDPIDTATSLYSTMIKGGVQNKSILDVDNPYINTICHHQETIVRWGSVFGVDKIDVRIYDKGAFHQNNILSDFLKASELPDSLNYTVPPRENISLDILSALLLQKINLKIPGFVNREVNLSRANIERFFSKYPLSTEPVKPSPELIEKYRIKFADSNDWVRENYFPNLPRLFPEKNAGVQALPFIDMDALANLISDMWLSQGAEIRHLKEQIHLSSKNTQ